MDSTGPTSPETPDTNPAHSASNKRIVAAGLVIAAAILAGAWLLVGGSNFEGLGTGGVNADLLPNIGDEAPDLTAVTIDGEIISLSDYRGTPVWLNFWGSWCPPCRSEMPDMQAAFEVLHPQGLELLAVSLGDKPSEAHDFAQKNGATFTVLLDPDRTLTSAAYPIYNFPTHIFVDEQGIVRNIVMSQMSTTQALEAAGSIMTVADTG